MRVIDLTLPSTAENLALDEALLIEADEGRAGAVLRYWEPTEFAVVLGASRRTAADLDLPACRADAVPIFRRSSGGGTVLIGPGVLNATVVLPQSAAPGLAAVDTAQRYVLDRMAAALGTVTSGVQVQGSGDLVLGGRKFSGSAQRRLRHWFLVHLSILCAFPLERIPRYLREPDRQPEYRQRRPHVEFVGNLGSPSEAVRAAITAEWAPSTRLPLPPEGTEPVSLLRAQMQRLLAERFANPAWIERL
jgi:lipoate-protein ligase A